MPTERTKYHTSKYQGYSLRNIKHRTKISPIYAADDVVLRLRFQRFTGRQRHIGLVDRNADGAQVDPTKESNSMSWLSQKEIGLRRSLRVQQVSLELVHLMGRYNFLSGSFHGRGI